VVAAFGEGLQEAGYVEGENLRSNITGQTANTSGWLNWPPPTRAEGSKWSSRAAHPAALAAKTATSTIPTTEILPAQC